MSVKILDDICGLPLIATSLSLAVFRCSGAYPGHVRPWISPFDSSDLLLELAGGRRLHLPARPARRALPARLSCTAGLGLQQALRGPPRNGTAALRAAARAQPRRGWETWARRCLPPPAWPWGGGAADRPPPFTCGASTGSASRPRPALAWGGRPPPRSGRSQSGRPSLPRPHAAPGRPRGHHRLGPPRPVQRGRRRQSGGHDAACRRSCLVVCPRREPAWRGPWTLRRPRS